MSPQGESFDSSPVSDKILEDLPSSATVKGKMVAVNETGVGPASEEVQAIDPRVFRFEFGF